MVSAVSEVGGGMQSHRILTQSDMFELTSIFISTSCNNFSDFFIIHLKIPIQYAHSRPGASGERRATKKVVSEPQRNYFYAHPGHCLKNLFYRLQNKGHS